MDEAAIALKNFTELSVRRPLSVRSTHVSFMHSTLTHDIEMINKRTRKVGGDEWKSKWTLYQQYRMRLATWPEFIDEMNAYNVYQSFRQQYELTFDTEI